ncbi:hypothetical protein C8Q80DRAFT_392884 [Daedaleopsis nitida]|nr:hypothetical protein C8Q80DRAFT_392884 [Daedaleopsis nitida]
MNSSQSLLDPSARTDSPGSHGANPGSPAATKQARAALSIAAAWQQGSRGPSEEVSAYDTNPLRSVRACMRTADGFLLSTRSSRTIEGPNTTSHSKAAGRGSRNRRVLLQIASSSPRVPCAAGCSPPPPQPHSEAAHARSMSAALCSGAAVVHTPSRDATRRAWRSKHDELTLARVGRAHLVTRRGRDVPRPIGPSARTPTVTHALATHGESAEREPECCGRPLRANLLLGSGIQPDEHPLQGCSVLVDSPATVALADPLEWPSAGPAAEMGPMAIDGVHSLGQCGATEQGPAGGAASAAPVRAADMFMHGPRTGRTSANSRRADKCTRG